mgnify:CR=1 FL=1
MDADAFVTKEDVWKAFMSFASRSEVRFQPTYQSFMAQFADALGSEPRQRTVNGRRKWGFPGVHLRSKDDDATTEAAADPLDVVNSNCTT